MSQRAYALHRKALGLVGSNHRAVQFAIKAGRLGVPGAAGSAVNGDGKVFDALLADRLWAENTNYADAPQNVRDIVMPDSDQTAGPGATMAEANRIEKIWKARQAELKFKEEAKELVPASDVRREVADVFGECRVKMLGIPTFLRQQDPSLTDAQLTMFEGAIRDALKALSETKL